MVLVLMGDEHRIQMVDALTEHLLPEVGTGIHSHRHLLRANQNGSSSALITGVFRLAYRTLAPNHRDTLRSAAT